MTHCISAAHPVTLAFTPLLSPNDIQAVVRALCRRLGIDRETTFRWMLGFSDLVLSAFSEASTDGSIQLRPIRGRRRIGLEMTLENPRPRDWTRDKLAWWFDECETQRRAPAQSALLVRKWADPLEDRPF